MNTKSPIRAGNTLPQTKRIIKGVNRSKSGFTIVELMIATTVFAVFLLMLTMIVIQITRTYSKGVIASKTQETARAISAELSRAVQFGGSTVRVLGTPPNTICAGSLRYSFVLGKQVKTTPTPPQIKHALVADSSPTCLALDLATLTFDPAKHRELIPENMRLSFIEVTSDDAESRLYKITVRVVYGDDDLLENPTTPAANCKAAIGNQFCAVSELVTKVEKRL